MQHDIRLVYIYTNLRESFQNRFTQITVDVHGALGIVLSCTSCLYLESNILIRIYRIHIGNYIFTQLLKAFILYMNNGTNGRDTKYSLEIINCLIKIKICQSIDIDSALCFGYFKFTLATSQCISDLVAESVFKDISVLALHADLSVLYQK